MSLRIPKGSALVIAALLLLEIFCWIEVDLYAPSFPQIRQFFGTTEEMVQWTLSLNFLGYFLSSLLVGPMADSLGRRPVVLGGAALFILGSLLCCAAPDLPTLFAGRVLQGAGVSAPTTLAVTIVADVHDGDRQARINAVMNSVVTITMAAAPMAGAWLSERYGWRSSFVLIFAGALASTALIFLLVPETLGREQRQPFAPARIMGNYARLLRSGFFLSTAFGLTLLAAPYWVFIATIPFLFQETLGVPMRRYVLLQGAVVGLFSVLSLAVPFLIGRTDPGRMLRGSLLVVLAASVLLCLHALFLPDSAPWITGLMCLFIAGIVWPCACFFPMIFAAFPDMKGSASSLCSAIRMLVMAAAIGVNARLYGESFRSVGLVILVAVGLGLPLLLLARRRGELSMGGEGAGLH